MNLQNELTTHTAQFVTRPSYEGFGDLAIDGTDLGWHSREDAEAEAKKLNVKLEIFTETDYVVRNARRV